DGGAARTRAAVLEAPRRFQVAARARPVAGRGEAVVRVAATAVCHTDLAIYTGRHPGVHYPVVLGHEAAGVVEAVGPDTHVAVGTRVVINPIIACGACDCCVRGDQNLCRRAGLLGRELDGSLAEHLVLPERYLHPLPGEIGLEAATLIETLATVRHAQQRVSIDPGDAVVVLGQGAPAGSSCSMRSATSRCLSSRPFRCTTRNSRSWARARSSPRTSSPPSGWWRPAP